MWNLEFLTELRACWFWSFVTCTLQNCPGRACTALERTKVWLRKDYWKKKKKYILDLAAFAMSEVLRASCKRVDGSSGSSVMWRENYYCQQGRGHQELETFLRFSWAPWASSNSCRHAPGSWRVPKAFGVAVKHRSHKAAECQPLLPCLKSEGRMLSKDITSSPGDLGPAISGVSKHLQEANEHCAA